MPLPHLSHAIDQPLNEGKDMFVSKDMFSALDDISNTFSPETPRKRIVSPVSASSPLSFASEEEQVESIGKTEQKILEDKGLLAEEPLLKDNPHRFVLFPIQDNEVRLALL